MEEPIIINSQNLKTLPLEVDFPYVIADAGKLKESVWDAWLTIEDDKIMNLGFYWDWYCYQKNYKLIFRRLSWRTLTYGRR